MNRQQVSRYNMLVRVTAFGAEHADRFHRGSLGAKLFAAAGAAAGKLGQYATTQSQGQRLAVKAATDKSIARDTLRAALEAIAATARALAVETPGLDSQFPLPAGKNDHELVAIGTSFAKDAAPLAARFVAHGLEKTFVADLKSAIDAFERTTLDRVQARAALAGARAGIGAAMEAAFAVLRQLDPIVANTLRGEPALQAEWASIRRIERGPVSAPAEPAVTPVPPAPPAAPAVPVQPVGSGAGV